MHRGQRKHRILSSLVGFSEIRHLRPYFFFSPHRAPTPASLCLLPTITPVQSNNAPTARTRLSPLSTRARPLAPRLSLRQPYVAKRVSCCPLFGTHKPPQPQLLRPLSVPCQMVAKRSSKELSGKSTHQFLWQMETNEISLLNN